MELNARTRDFIERVAILGETSGIPRSSGRMFGLLLVADGPLSLDAIVAALGVTKPTISSNARLYEQLGLLQRTTRPGDRKHYYQITPGAFERVTERRIESLHRFSRLAAEGIEIVGENNTGARRRLDEMRRFYEFAASGMEQILSQWRERDES